MAQTIRIVQGPITCECTLSDPSIWTVYVSSVRQYQKLYLDWKDGSIIEAPHCIDKLDELEREALHSAMVGHAEAAGWKFS